MSPPQNTPQDDERAGSAPMGGHEPARPQREPREAALPPRLSVLREPGGGLPPRLKLHLAGELDADTAPGLREELAALAARSAGGVLVLDLSGITFCDSAGLYTLLGISRTLPLADIDVLFTGAGAQLRAAAARAGLTTHLALGESP
ncbi:STAS domain-containing protein [Streptomyces sp. NPDC014882]|uniref:STAS domain-containing protein n=1 Tax=Streptomyces sp. NPDC014882 TaxID=3364927 RepID=UPI0037025964